MLHGISDQDPFCLAVSSLINAARNYLGTIRYELSKEVSGTQPEI